MEIIDGQQMKRERQHLRDAMQAGRAAERARIVAWLRGKQIRTCMAAELRWAADRLPPRVSLMEEG